MATQSEENYLKAIFKIAEKDGGAVGTNAIAAVMMTSAASVTDMVKRLSEKNLLTYQKYRGVSLSESGTQAATALIRKHRLWEVFLVEKLGFAWDEVHEMAEELEHIPGDALIERLDAFLDHPKFDPHGDPIPDAEGRWAFRQQVVLLSLTSGQQGIVTGVNDHSPVFLQYLDTLGLNLGKKLEMLEIFPYDGSVKIRLETATELILSEKVSKNLFVKTIL